MATQSELADLIEQEVRNDAVVSAFRSIPRAAFVPDEHVPDAYEDVPLRIPRGQVTTQPSLIARMLAALELRHSDRVLEVGTGYGFQTALLARLAAHVWTIERFADLAERARERLQRAQIHNAEVVVADGTDGLPEQAPFDAIVISAAFPSVPPPLAEQLRPGGRLVQPIGRGGNEEVVLFRKGVHGLERERTLTGAHFVPLVGRHGFPE